jgi:hypothetical protein
MPKITQTAQEQSVGSPIDNMITNNPEITISTNPVFICGVNRKVNIGNFENIDIYAGISIPLSGGSFLDQDSLSSLVNEAAAYGFNLVSKETGERYSLIKESQQNK